MFEIIAGLAIIEVVFLVTLLLFLLLYRVRESRREIEREAERGALQAAFDEWRAGELPDDGLADVLEEVSFDALEEFLEGKSSFLAAADRDREAREFRRLVRESSWMTEARELLDSPSLPWWRHLRALSLFRWVGTDDDESLFREILTRKEASAAVTASALVVIRHRTPGDLMNVMLDMVREQSVARDRLLRDTLLAYGSDLVRPVIERLRSTDSSREIKFLLSVVQDLPRPSLRPLVLEHADDERLEVRVEAVRALRFFPGNGETRSALVAAADDPEWPVRTQAARGLGAVGGEEALRVLVRMLEDESWWVRLRAGLALAGRGEDGARALRRVAGEEADAFARDMARYVLRVTEAEREARSA